MKKSIFIIAVFAAFTFTSCKKDYTCECVYTGTTVVASSTTIETTKKKAEDACTGLNTSGYTTCSIK